VLAKALAEVLAKALAEVLAKALAEALAEALAGLCTVASTGAGGDGAGAMTAAPTTWSLGAAAA